MKPKLVWSNSGYPDVEAMSDCELERHFRRHEAPCLMEERPISENDARAIKRWFGGDTP